MDDSEKRFPVSFRLTKRHKRCLELGALHEQRSHTNFIEKLISEYCELHGIDPTRTDSKNDKKGTL